MWKVAYGGKAGGQVCSSNVPVMFHYVVSAAVAADLSVASSYSFIWPLPEPTARIEMWGLKLRVSTCTGAGGGAAEGGGQSVGEAVGEGAGQREGEGARPGS